MLQNAAFKYFCKRPAVPGAIPKPENNSILSVTNYEDYRFVGAKKFLAEVVYAQPLSSDIAVAYELYADKLNADIQQEMHSLAAEIGAWEQEKLREPNRLTCFYAASNSYAPKACASLEDMRARKETMLRVTKRAERAAVQAAG